MKLTRLSIFLLAIITSSWSGAAEAISFSKWYCIFFYCGSEPEPLPEQVPEPEYDFVVVGAGSGGGTVASRLAHLGHSVLLIDVGGDPADNNPTYTIPAAHPFASEKPGKVGPIM
ncbi:MULTISPECIES: hypothetical protein [unclassified Endozoicomonas]|uniref:hypothetical protein n=1 Tax=unclassified Endozoicomonas TaxID=2644528 RepID=UPI003BB4B200